MQTVTQPITLSAIARLVAEVNDLRESSWDNRWKDHGIDHEMAVDHVLGRERLGFNDQLRSIVLVLARDEDATDTCNGIADADTAAQRAGDRLGTTTAISVAAAA